MAELVLSLEQTHRQNTCRLNIGVFVLSLICTENFNSFVKIYLALCWCWCFHLSTSSSSQRNKLLYMSISQKPFLCLTLFVLAETKHLCDCAVCVCTVWDSDRVYLNGAQCLLGRRALRRMGNWGNGLHFLHSWAAESYKYYWYMFMFCTCK